MPRFWMTIGGHRHRPSCRRYSTSDIDISYSDIWTKYVRLNPHIPISEEFQYQHQLPFRYRTKSISDILISKIDKPIPNDPTKFLVVIDFSHWLRTHNLYSKILVSYLCATRVYKLLRRISDIRKKFIPISDIMSDSAHLSPISDIPISGSVWYHWSRISDWVPTYVNDLLGWPLNGCRSFVMAVIRSLHVGCTASEFVLQILMTVAQMLHCFCLLLHGMAAAWSMPGK